MLLTAAMVPGLVATGASGRVDKPECKPRFAAGERVLVRNLQPQGHTRLPAYLRDKTGTIAMAHGVIAFPDTQAHGLGARPQHVYAVRFQAQDLWGASAGAQDTVLADLFDDYLAPA